MGSSVIHGFLPLNGEIKHHGGILFLLTMQSHSLPSLGIYALCLSLLSFQQLSSM